MATQIVSKLTGVNVANSDDALGFMRMFDNSLSTLEEDQTKVHTNFLLYVLQHAETLCLDIELVKTRVKALLKDKLNNIQTMVAKENLNKLYNSNDIVKIKSSKYKHIKTGIPLNADHIFIDYVLKTLNDINTQARILSYEHIHNFIGDIVITEDSDFTYIDHKFGTIDILVWKNRPSKIDEAFTSRLLTIVTHSMFNDLAAIEKDYLKSLLATFSNMILADSEAKTERIVLPKIASNEKLRLIYPTFIKVVIKIAANNIMSIIKGYINCQDTNKTDTSEIIGNIIEEFTKKEVSFNGMFEQMYREYFSEEKVTFE